MLSLGVRGVALALKSSEFVLLLLLKFPSKDGSCGLWADVVCWSNECKINCLKLQLDEKEDYSLKFVCEGGTYITGLF